MTLFFVISIRVDQEAGGLNSQKGVAENQGLFSWSVELLAYWAVGPDFSNGNDYTDLPDWYFIFGVLHASTLSWQSQRCGVLFTVFILEDVIAIVIRLVFNHVWFMIIRKVTPRFFLLYLILKVLIIDHCSLIFLLVLMQIKTLKLRMPLYSKMIKLSEWPVSGHTPG